MKEYFLSLSYNAETVLLRRYMVADAGVSEESTGMYTSASAHKRVGGGSTTDRDEADGTVPDLYLVGARRRRGDGHGEVARAIHETLSFSLLTVGVGR